MPNVQELAQEINASLDRITQAGSDQQKLHQAVTEAKSKVQQLVQAAQQGAGSTQAQR